MKRKIVFLGLFGAVILMLGVVIFLRREPSGLKVYASLDAERFLVSQPVLLRCKLVNEGGAPVGILTPSVDEWTFEVIVYDSQGKRHPYAHRKVFVESRDAGRPLAAGESVPIEVDLTKEYSLPPGTYSLRATYRTLNYPKLDVWYGIVKSEPLVFEIAADASTATREP
jgi:hypothetical protein